MIITKSTILLFLLILSSAIILHLKLVMLKSFSSDNFFVLASASSIDKDIKETLSNKSKILKSQEIGKIIAEKAKIKGISKVAFDKSGCKYHGCIKAVADSARKHGLSF